MQTCSHYLITALSWWDSGDCGLAYNTLKQLRAYNNNIFTPAEYNGQPCVFICVHILYMTLTLYSVVVSEASVLFLIFPR